jgi:multidrug efflux pump subunit AcrB
VRATYPGANPKVIAETVASPIEQQINGIEDMLYMFSQATSDGRMTLTITFALGTDLDNAQVQVPEPRGTDAAALARRSAAHRRRHREVDALISSWSCTSSRRTSGTTTSTWRTTPTCA